MRKDLKQISHLFHQKLLYLTWSLLHRFAVQSKSESIKQLHTVQCKLTELFMPWTATLLCFSKKPISLLNTKNII